MLGVYVFAAIVGAGLLAFSVLAGGDGDHDAGADHPVLADADHPGWGELAVAFFRPRNVIFAAAAFGLTGTLLTLIGANAVFTLVAASGLGAAFWVLSHGVFTLLRHTETEIPPVSDAQLMGERGRATLPLEPGRPGKVTCVLGEREVYLTARLAPEAAAPIPAGGDVVVVRVTNGIAEVVTPEQYDRLLPA